MLKTENPILKGFYPDPSICRVGEDYYLVTSSFSYFPGVPVFHSKDLAHWEQIGNVLDREEQLSLDGGEISRGIFAPVIRWYNGIFYLITTNIDQGGNFIVTATNPAGPWSEPYYLGEEAKGIDPSLFFDEDGTCYYVGTRPNSEGVTYNGDWEIWIQELDVKNMRLTGDSRKIWKGAMQNAIWPEGPHLYKVGKYYYLIHAEGGTSTEHSICVARSKSLQEEFEGCPANPIFSHRQLGKQYPITCAGHADLFDDEDGNWYMVMLACRRSKGCSSMGRETFLAKVQWEDGWPVVNPGIGKLEQTMEIPGESVRFSDEFGKNNIFLFYENRLNQELLSIYGRDPQMYSLKERPGYLRLFAHKHHVGEKKRSAYLGVRQKEYHFSASVGVEFYPESEQAGAGFLLFQNHQHFLRAEIKKYKQGRVLYIIQTIKGEEKILAEEVLEDGFVEIIFQAEDQEATFYVKQKTTTQTVLKNTDLRFFSTEYTGGFVGCTMGMYASGYGEEKGDYADFAWFSIITQ